MKNIILLLPALSTLTRRYLKNLFVIFAFLFFLSLDICQGKNLLEEGFKCLKEWDLNKAASIAQKVITKNPDNYEGMGLLGLVYFYQGDYFRALDYLEKAANLNDEDNRWKNICIFVKGTQDLTCSFKSFESKHFCLYLDEKDKILKNYALQCLELAYEKIGKELGFTPLKKVRVEIYPTSESFNWASSLSKKQMESCGAVGICKFNRIMIISPRCLAFGYRWLDALTHEYTHYLIAYLTKMRCPLWLNEGTAKYHETLWNREQSAYLIPIYKNFLIEALKSNKWISFEEMKGGMPTLKNQKEVTLAFAEVSSLVDFLISCYGKKKLTTFLRALRKTNRKKSVEKKFKSVFGVTISQFKKGWINFLKEMNLQITPGAILERFKLKENEQINELEEFVEEEVRGYIKLGDLFYEQGKFKIALIQYNKARKRQPANPVVLNKIGITYVALKEYDEAKKVFNLSIRQGPNYVTTYTNLGDLYFKLEQFPSALENYMQSNQINPFNPHIHKNMGLIYHKRGEEKKAQEEWEITNILLATN